MLGDILYMKFTMLSTDSKVTLMMVSCKSNIIRTIHMFDT